MDRVNDTKTALVTGANKGIGFAIAQGLGALGFTVAVGARDDAGREEAVADLRAAGTDAFGVVRVTNAMLPLLGRAGSPRIVNMSSNTGSLTLQAGPMLAAYAPSKSMLNSITAQYARRLAGTNVIVNACCPGYVATDFTGFNAPRKPEQGAAIALRPATRADDGPRGGFFDDEGVVPWGPETDGKEGAGRRLPATTGGGACP